MAVASSHSLLSNPDTPSKTQYRATQLWRKMVQGFRSDMPVTKRRVRMKIYEDCFTGSEATVWLKDYLVSSGLFKTIEQQQVFNLLQKFLESSVIENCKRKESEKRCSKFEDHHLYRFVLCPCPLNFIEEDNSVSDNGGSNHYEEDSICRANSHALKRVHSNITAHSPSPELESDSLTDITQSVAIETAANNQPLSMTTHTITPALTAAIWKEHTSARLLKLLDIPSLDLVVNTDIINGDVISDNISYNSQKHNESNPTVEDVPGWVRMAIKCISNWPEGCPEELTGGLPLYQGFEQDVLQSIITYFQSQSQPLIPHKLYDLYTSIHPLIVTDPGRATRLLQVCTLLLVRENRIRLHRLLRMINKACLNTLLHLSEARVNQHVLLEQFCPLILRPKSGGITNEQLTRRVWIIKHMVDNYREMFLVPSELRSAVKREIELIETGQIQRPNPVVPKYCQRVSVNEYEEQRYQTSEEHLVELLRIIVRDENMSSKEKKKKLKMFQKSYPEIYIKHFPGTPTNN